MFQNITRFVKLLKNVVDCADKKLVNKQGSLGMKVTALEKYNDYINNNPDCQIYNQEQILSIMLEKNLITKAEMEEIKKGSVFGNGIVSFTDREDDFSFMGVNLSDKSRGINQQPQNFVEKPRKYHSQFKNLEIDEKGNIDSSQFALEAVERKYNSKEYTVNKTVSNEGVVQTVTVYNKKGDKPVVSYVTRDFGDGIPVYDCKIYGKNGELKEAQRILDGKVFYHRVNYSDGYSKSVFYKDSTKNHYDYVQEDMPDGTQKNTFYNDKNQIQSLLYFDKDFNVTKNIIFSQGQPYKEVGKDNEITNLLAQDIAADVDENNDRGYWVKKMSLKKNILNRIDSANINEVDKDFYLLTGKSLYKLVKKDKELVSHVEKAVNGSSDIDFQSKYIAEALVDDIYGAGSGNLENHVKMLTPENIEKVLKEYNDSAQIKAQPVENILQKIGFGKESVDKIVKKSGMAQSLISAIDAEINLPQAKKEELIKHVAENVIKSSENNNKYVDDIKFDMAVNRNKAEKLEVDMLRMLNRGSKIAKPIFTSPNGTIDNDFSQGRTGDCWLLAGIISAVNNPAAKKKLESQIQTDPDTKDVKVHLAGVNKTYVIRSCDIENGDHLSQGDGDVRALELAIDRYIKEQAYFGNNKIDIVGNNTKFFFDVLFGKGKMNYFSDVKDVDYNDKNKIFTLGSIEENFGIETPDKKAITILANHAYAVKGSGKDFLYLINPHDSSKIIKVPKQELEKRNAIIYQMDI